MDRLADTQQFMDLAGLDGLRSRAQKDQKAALKEVAQQFEGIFVQMLMKSMREANQAFEADSPFNSQYTKFYESMHDQQMSVNLSSKGMLGLADLMVQQLSPEGTKMTPASVLRTHEAPAAAEKSEAPVATVANLDKQPTATTTEYKLPERQHVFPEQQQLAAVLRGEKLPTQAANEDMRSPESFVKTLYPYAKDAAEQLGTTPEVLLAQSALETGWGQKMTKADNGQSSNNLFNIKAGSRWSGNTTAANTLEYEQGQAVSKKEEFRVYDSIKASFDDYVNLISGSERYQAARENAANPGSFIKGLADAGYATDPQYAQKVMRVLHSIKQDVSQWLGAEQSSNSSVSGAISYGD
ncbi:flagellar assembly peptidoglycan hydrolase FlgJ [Shewanella mangrovi]|uniref:flagellar assembly peptidoglycan hydrolase FlgJ n=1 Tax=Shewanella mangrovi TaxID=1515746 RepID=UPI00068AD8BF|nr:flagellar assembly peptidoglycan hydrolase FlgJ [Shewanella mangrovi]